MAYNGVKCHDELVKKQQPKLSFDASADYNAWKQSIKEKYIELLGLDVIAQNTCEPQFTIEEEVQKEGIPFGQVEG